MIILSNSIAQTLDPGQSVTFDTVVSKTGCSECFRVGSGVVTLRQQKAIYEIKFGANIGAATAGDAAQLAISINGSPLVEGSMISTTAAAGDLNNVGKDTAIRTCCCGPETCTITNTGTTTVNIDKGPSLFIRRIA